MYAYKAAFVLAAEGGVGFYTINKNDAVSFVCVLVYVYGQTLIGSADLNNFHRRNYESMAT